MSLGELCKDDAILATNTSAIPITQIGAATRRPQSVVGMHFFSPVPMMRLCELVRETFPLTPKGIIEYLNLRRPVYRKTAAGGHFGRSEPEFTWEGTAAAKKLEKAASSGAAAR